MSDIDIAGIFISFVVLLFSLTVHEAAHAWTASRLGDPTARLLGRVSLNPVVHADPVGTVLFPLLSMITNLPLLGWAKPVPVNTARLAQPRRDYMLVAAAGPISNIVLAVVALIALHALAAAPSSDGALTVVAPLGQLFGRGFLLNLTLAFFNLLPIPPLDGGTVIGGLLPRDAAAKYDGFVRPYGVLLLYALMFAGAIDYLVFRPVYFIASVLL